MKHEKNLKRRDVTLEEKKTLQVYTFLNLIAFSFQAIAVAVMLIINEPGKIFNMDDKITLSVKNEILLVEVLLITLLEVLFVILPLPFMRCFGPRQHFQNILILKVKWCFAVQCVI